MAKTQLFMLHFAGGSVYAFAKQIEHLGAFEAIPLELPGRGKRVTEPLIKDYHKAVEDMYQQIERQLRPAPYVIYGHSMGSLLSLAVCQKLEQKGKGPQQLIVSGNSGPGDWHKDGRHLQPHDEFVADLQNLGGVPQEVFDSKELMDYVEPIIRADFEVNDTAKSQRVQLTQTPIYILMGSEEDHVDKINNWANFTQAKTTVEVLPGKHFFINDHPDFLAKTLGKLNIH